MSSADRMQNAHRLPDALTERLNAIKFGTAISHDWHQAGVLVAELVRSVHLQYGSDRQFHDDCLEMADDALWLYDRALAKLLPDNTNLKKYAILCDYELLQAFKRYLTRTYDSVEQFTELKQIIDELTSMDYSMEGRTHQLAIAHGFMARALWWQYDTDLGYLSVARQAEQHQAHANRLFGEDLPESPDGGKAYCSHLLAMALLHQQTEVSGWRGGYVWPALRLALKHSDLKQALRATAIGLFGIRGERWARKRRGDTLGTFAEAADRLKTLRRP